jgi:subtilisin-like proprotein convertase family protein
MKKIITTCTALLAAVFLMAQSSAQFWNDVSEAQIILPENAAVEPVPAVYRTLSLDLNAMVNYLRLAPMEFTEAAENQPLTLELPTPDGGMETFAVWESPIMEPALADEFPMIKTFGGKSLDRSGVTIRFAQTLHGFNAIVQTVGGTWFISPYASGQVDFYMSYWLKDAVGNENQLPEMACGTIHSGDNSSIFDDVIVDENLRSGGTPVNLYTYRLAMATTVEYSAAHGNTPATVLSAVTNVINQVNSIYERDNAIRLILIANTTQTFYFGSGASDPYTNSNAATMSGENPAVLNAAYGSSGYDVGHVFGTSNGGVVGIGTFESVCAMPTLKGRAASNIILSASSVFYITVTHEFGHQFNAYHTFNKCNDQNEEPLTAYEPGGGSTIMSYTGDGVCPGSSLQDNADSYFHNNSLVRIKAYSRNSSTGGSCAQVVTIGNNTPEATIPVTGGFNIPISTPFELTGQATDMDGDNLTYCWEQYDLGPPSPLGMPMGTAPLFRSNPPSDSPTRVFPKIQTIVANASDPQEVLPTISRVMTFRFTVRDNHAEAGGYDFKEIQFNATAQAGPFLVTKPNAAGVTWEVGQYTEVTWDVANTDAAPVNCQFVNIRLSKDGGFTYPILLLAQTPNDGSAFVSVPEELTSAARVRVEAADNIFFDISNQNFSIVPASQPGFSLVSTPAFGTVCVPSTFAVNLQTTSLLGFSENITFSAEGLPAGATASFNNNPVTPGGEAIMTINTDGVTADGIFTITIKAEADGVPAAERTVDVNFVNSDFSDLEVLTPVDGASGQTGLPTFTWTPLPNAHTYDIQVSTDPGFGTIVSEATGLANTTFTPSATLEDNTIYYWRIRPANECGDKGFLDAASFHTVSQTCETLSRDTTYQIAPTGLPYIKSKITIPQSGTISDINLKNIKGKHEAIADLAFRLKNPAGDSITLLSALLCNSQDFNMGFNDESPVSMVPCPPNSGNSYKPTQPLSTFNGQDVAGDWTLIVAVINTLGNGGNFEGWAMEYCAALTPKDPFLVKNDTLRVPPNGTRLVYQNRLVVDDEDNLPSELQFTIVKNTQHGTVFLDGQPLGVGGHFTMLDVYSSAVEYTNTNPNAVYDYFTFAVNDGNGGYFGTPRFNIKIDANADPTGVNDLADGNEISLFPNPASNQVSIGFKKAIQGKLTVSILNAQGQAMQVRHFDQAVDNIQLKTGDLPSGVYVVQVRSQEGVFARKLLIGKR